jgi:hypothetical protein
VRRLESLGVRLALPGGKALAAGVRSRHTLEFEVISLAPRQTDVSWLRQTQVV